MEIKIDNLTYKTIFNCVSCNFKSGQISSIVGKNSSGKTSLLNLLYKLDDFDGGTIKVSKRSLTKKMLKVEVYNYRKDIFYIMQDYEKMFVQSNILKDIKYLCGKNVDKLDELLKEFNLNKEILKKTYSDLSHGELKKILIISMILSDSNIILLDEPTIDLDDKGIFLLVKWLKKLKRDGKLLIVVSTNSDFIFKISDKIYTIINKKINIEEDVNKFLEDSTKTDRVGLEIPKLLEFRNIVLKSKKIKLMYRDNINDLIKDVYNNAR